MKIYVRTSAWNDGGDFQDAAKKHYTALYWYAIGVYQMQQRALNDAASWWYFAAMHAEYVLPSADPGEYPGWGYIPTPPAVPIKPLPPSSKAAPFSSTQYWDQCQHLGWYFAPWHRGYLVAIEARLREDIVNSGGPSDWALPYWNYFGAGNEYEIPPAFMKRQLPAPPAHAKIPDPLPNPLFVTARYGPDGDGIAYVPTAAGSAAHPGDKNYKRGLVTDDCMQAGDFTVGGGGHGFGGDGSSVFAHFGGATGDLEGNPHNLVHVYVGGRKGLSGSDGLMADAGLAALDPIFYLHHANIDRMWAAWNNAPKGAHPAGAPAPTVHSNPTKPGWTAGPTDRGFVMPMPKSGSPGASQSWPYTPADVNSLGLAKTDYTYDQWPAVPASPPPAILLLQRLESLGKKPPAGPSEGSPKAVTETNTELMGANKGTLTVEGSGASTIVTLSPQVRQKFSASLDLASPAAPPDLVYLALEGVRGTRDSAVLNAYINLPEGADPNNYPNLLAGSVGLFGLRIASARSGDHAGNGLSFTMNITKIVDQLYMKQAMNEAIRVAILPSRELPQQTDITIGRVAIYRRGR